MLLAMAIMALTLCSHKAAAQTGTGPWDLLSDLLEQMDNSTNENFFNNFEDLNGDWSIDPNGNNETLNGLFDELGNNPFPTGTLDPSFLGAWAPGADLLDNGLDGFGLNLSDEDTIFGAFNNVQDIFATNFDSLGGLYGQYQDSVMFGNPEWEVQIINFDGLVDGQMGILQDTFDMFVDPDIANGTGDVAGLLGSLFSASLFPDLEIAFGLQEADYSYWGSDYTAQAKVIRVGSVPRFDQNTVICQHYTSFPIEARWHMQASWINQEIVTLDGDYGTYTGNIIGNQDIPGNSIVLEGDGNVAPPPSNNGQGISGNAIALGAQDNFTPMQFSADFAIMTAPNLGRLGNTSFRLITSLGIEAGTYAPAHRDYNPIRTSRNKGFATGYGPQFGAGFSMTRGALLIYTIGTVSQGETLRCALPYGYNSRRFEAGIRYADIINVRYSTAYVSWQPNENRVARVNNQFTVGLIF